MWMMWKVCKGKKGGIDRLVSKLLDGILLALNVQIEQVALGSVGE
jgi:hypothetical protein